MSASSASTIPKVSTSVARRIWDLDPLEAPPVLEAMMLLELIRRTLTPRLVSALAERFRRGAERIRTEPE
jgi:hypothetical protein